MKANAPEKLYLSKNIYGTYLYQVPDPDDETAVEYTRTDAFIDKAIEYIITHIPDMHTLGVSAKMDECIIKDFRKYMEGE